MASGHEELFVPVQNPQTGDPPMRFRVSSQSSATTVVAFSLSPTGFFGLITKFSCLNCLLLAHHTGEPAFGEAASDASRCATATEAASNRRPICLTNRR